MSMYDEYHLTDYQKKRLVAGSAWQKVPLEDFSGSKRGSNMAKNIVMSSDEFEKELEKQAQKRWLFKNGMISGILVFAYFFVIAVCVSSFNFHPLYFGGFLLPLLAVFLVGLWSK